MSLKLTKNESFKKNENEILSLFELYKVAFEISQDAVIVFDKNKIKNFNNKTLKIFGFTELFNKNFNINDHIIDDSINLTELQKNNRTVKIKDKDNKIFLALVTFNTAFVSGKSLTFVVIKDLSDIHLTN